MSRESSSLLRRHLANAGRPVDEQDGSIYASDVVIEFPYAPPGHTRKREGIEAIQGFLAAIGTFAEDFRIGEPTIYDVEGGLIAEYHGDAVFKDTGLPYSQDYIVVAKVVDGKIVHLREYYDPIRVLRALGEFE